MLDRANKIAVLFVSVHGQKLPDLTGKGYSIGQPLRREPVRYVRWAKMLRYVRCIGLSKDCVIKMQQRWLRAPATIKDVPPPPVEVAVVFERKPGSGPVHPRW